MRMPRKSYLFGAATLALLGAGVAEAATARLHTMQVDAPDGRVVQVQYTGDVAPHVQFVPADEETPAGMPMMADPFAQLQRMSAMMDAQMQAMMQRAALGQQQAMSMQQQAVANGQHSGSGPGFAVAGDMPQGMQVSYYSSSTDASGCTLSVSYSSDGSQAAPKVTQATSDDCEAATRSTRAIPAKVEVPVEEPSGEGLGRKV